MGNLSVWHAPNVSATANISLWGSRASCFCHLSHSKPYVAGANLMTLIHSFQLLIVTAFAHEKSPAARRKCLHNPLYWVVNAQFMCISTVNSNEKTTMEH